MELVGSLGLVERMVEWKKAEGLCKLLQVCMGGSEAVTQAAYLRAPCWD